VRDSSALLGRSVYIDKGPFRRIHPYFQLRNVDDTQGGLLLRRVVPGVELEGFWNSYIGLEQRTETIRAGNRLFDSSYYVVVAQMSPSQRIGDVSLTLIFGDDVDFANVRPARGATVSLQGTLRPTDHLALQLNANRRWLDVSPTGRGPREARLFTADVARVKATYTFTSRAFLRLIAQRVRTDRATELYAPEFGVTRRDEGITGSALFAYKLNWQTVLFLGYSDDRALSVDDRLEPAGRALFFKISYAFQR
jgi:hypothetical protein